MRRKTHRTSRLHIRPLRMSDYASWFEAYVNGKEKQNQWDRAPMNKKKCTPSEFKKVVERHRDRARCDKCYIYALFHGRMLVGFIDISVYERGNMQFANLGYSLFNRYWGQGYAQEAVRASLKIGFKDLKLQRLEASIDLSNKRSLKLVKRLGFEREGIKRKYWFQEGRWDDQIIYVARPDLF